MKTLLRAVALAALVALPAHAKTVRATGAQSSPVPEVAAVAGVPWDAVIDEGRVIGQDPDPAVRLDILRDHAITNN
jgi:hypothetical protein